MISYFYFKVNKGFRPPYGDLNPSSFFGQEERIPSCPIFAVIAGAAQGNISAYAEYRPAGESVGNFPLLLDANSQAYAL